MKHLIIFCVFLLTTASLSAQLQRTTNPKFEKKIDRLLSESVPFVYVEDLAKKDKSELILLDAREWEEYKISHIPQARYIGYDRPTMDVLSDVEKDKEIVVYCSIGYRSEKIAERLNDMGYENVTNLYGSIFEWVNQGHEVENSDGEVTKKIHTYDKSWSRWMINKAYEKVW